MIIEGINLFPLCWKYDKPIADARSVIRQRSALLFRIHAHDGAWGWGEAAAFGGVADVVAQLVMNHLFPLIRGWQAEPRSIRDRLTRMTAHYGQKGLVLAAISGIEIALWDMLARRANMSLARLLGGGEKPLKAYAATGYYLAGARNADADLAYLENRMASLDMSRFYGAKIKVGLHGVADDVRRVRLARQIIGEEAILIADANNAYGYRAALAFARTVEDQGLLFLEEPLPFGMPELSAQLQKVSPVPIGGYELEMGKNAFAAHLRLRSVDYIQPDCIWSGGIIECLEIAEAARDQGIGVVPHNFASSLSSAANFHLLCASEAGTLVEWDASGCPFAEIGAEALRGTRGEFQFTDGAGLGIALQESQLSGFMSLP